MLTVHTTYSGPIDYDEQSVIEFPCGLPGFEEERRFILLEPPDTSPVVFLQSTSRADLRFLTLPVHLVDPAYTLAIADEDLQVLGPGTDTLCLAVIAGAGDGPPTANLLAPIVINLKARRAVQAIRLDSAYSHVHSLAPGAAPEDPECS